MWGGGLLDLDLDFETVVDISRKAGIKFYSVGHCKQDRNLLTNTKQSIAPNVRNPPVARCPEKLCAHLDGGAFTRTFDFHKVTEVQNFGVEGNYYCVPISVCAKIVGARISDEQLRYLEDQC